MTVAAIPHLEAEPTLLVLLDGLVRRDGPTSGLRQEVCIGVKRSTGYRWWRARLGPRFECGFVDGPSASAHVTLCLQESESERLIRIGRLDPGAAVFHVDGDHDVLTRFFARYTSKMTHFGARFANVEARNAYRIQRTGY